MGTLYIVATPIGNLEDISLRAIRVLFTSDVIACEDTRRTGLLLSELKKRYGWVMQTIEPKTPKLIPYFDEVETKRAPELLELLQRGSSVALVSDAGTPLISDPGFLLTSQAQKQGIPVVSVPGPSAATAALSVSCLPPTPFMFLGYPPEKQSHRLKLFESLPKETTCIFFCAPHKLATTLSEMKETLGDIEIVICREITKQFEETWRGTVSEALLDTKRFKGEIVVLVRL